MTKYAQTLVSLIDAVKKLKPYQVFLPQQFNTPLKVDKFRRELKVAIDIAEEMEEYLEKLGQMPENKAAVANADSAEEPHFISGPHATVEEALKYPGKEGYSIWQLGKDKQKQYRMREGKWRKLKI